MHEHINAFSRISLEVGFFREVNYTLLQRYRPPDMPYGSNAYLPRICCRWPHEI
jgi:hypothetical protein